MSIKCTRDINYPKVMDNMVDLQRPVFYCEHRTNPGWRYGYLLGWGHPCDACERVHTEPEAYRDSIRGKQIMNNTYSTYTNDELNHLKFHYRDYLSKFPNPEELRQENISLNRINEELKRRKLEKDNGTQKFEVQENEGWDGIYPKWFATDGEAYEQFDDEQEAQEYCDDQNNLAEFIKKHGRPPNTNDFFERQTAMLNKIYRKRII